MEKAEGRILKGSDVELQGRFQLNVAEAHQSPPKGVNPPLAKPQVHIVEKHPEFAVIEITCSCGTKTHVKCEYAAEQTAGPQ